MNCQAVQKVISAYVDRRLLGEERSRVERHLTGCRKCASESEQQTLLREALLSMPAARPPEPLDTRLRVLASRASSRRRLGVVGHTASRVKLVFENLMRPLALPFAGGLTSAVFLFSMLIPHLGTGFLEHDHRLQQHSIRNDVPTMLTTGASVESMADFVPKIPEDTLIEITIDRQGRMVDYSVPHGQMTSEIGNTLLFTTYSPATYFLRPTSGKILLLRSRIVVKG
jgi:hypothetical protein